MKKVVYPTEEDVRTYENLRKELQRQRAEKRREALGKAVTGITHAGKNFLFPSQEKIGRRKIHERRCAEILFGVPKGVSYRPRTESESIQKFFGKPKI